MLVICSLLIVIVAPIALIKLGYKKAPALESGPAVTVPKGEVPIEVTPIPPKSQPKPPELPGLDSSKVFSTPSATPGAGSSSTPTSTQPATR